MNFVSLLLPIRLSMKSIFEKKNRYISFFHKKMGWHKEQLDYHILISFVLTSPYLNS